MRILPVLRPFRRYLHFLSVHSATFRRFSGLSPMAAPSPSSEVLFESMDRKKRKVALVVSFLGSEYRGLQMNAKNEFKTIESELERALFESGLINPLNHGKLYKLKWSRSSRTDKGVHAARVIIATKLELPAAYVEERSSNSSGVTEEASVALPHELVNLINSRLPNDIRVLSCTRVGGGFQARHACVWREYEYLFPLSLIDSVDHPNEPTSDRLSRFDEILKKFVGHHSFHNFHRLQRKELYKKRREMPKWIPSINETTVSTERLQHADDSIDVQTDDGSDEEAPVEMKIKEGGGHGDSANDSDDIENNDFLEAAAMDSSEADTATSSPGTRKFYESWSPENHRVMAPKTQGTVYLCSCTEQPPLTIDGVPMGIITIRGQSFLLNQIRLMVGMAILIMRGLAPPQTLDLALQCPVFFPAPLAPAQGLLLADAGLSKSKSGQSYYFHENHRIGYLDYLETSGRTVFLSPVEHSECLKFKREHIYPRIQRDWCSNSSELTEVFKSDCHRFEVPKALSDQWSTQLTEVEQANSAREAVRRDHECVRIQTLLASLDQYAEDLRLRQECVLRRPSPVAGGNRTHSIAMEKGQRFKPISARNFLPSGLSTTLTVYYKLLPGEQVNEAMRLLAAQVLKRTLPYNSTVQDILQFVDSKGGKKWLQVPVPKNPFIH